LVALGTPPEDESGAGEGAPITATDPAANERPKGLAARVDAFIDDDGGENQTMVEPRRGRFASEPGIDVDMDDRPEPRSSEGSIDVRGDASSPQRPGENSVEIDLPEIKPRTSEGVIETRTGTPSSEPRASDSNIEVDLGGNTPPPRSSGSIDVNIEESRPVPRQRLASEPGIVADDADVVEEISQVAMLPVAAPRRPIPAPPLRPPAIPPPRPGAIPPPPPGRLGMPKLPPIKPPAIPPPRQTTPGFGMPPVPQVPIAMRAQPVEPFAPPAIARTKTDQPPPVVGRTKTDQPPPVPSRTPTSERPPLPRPSDTEPSSSTLGDDHVRSTGAGDSISRMSVDDVLGGEHALTSMEGGVEVSTVTPNVVIDQPLEAHLEHPSVVDKALTSLGESGETRAEDLAKQLESSDVSEPAAAAYVAYELGELYERRLADEARAVKAFGRALNLDPSLRPNLWAIRRVFYRRQLWPNLQKLIDAEIAYARDDYERADLLLEKARVSAHKLNDADDAREALDEAVRIAPQHQGVLLELERVLARAGDVPGLLDIWERLADAVTQPARKVSYLLELGRAAGAGGDLARAQASFDKAAAIAASSANLGAAERVARERLRVVEEHGTPVDVAAAIDALAAVLLAAFGPAGPGTEPGTTAAGERPTRATALRLELVALRRRQAQVARKDDPDRSWDFLQQALALSPGEPIVLADLTELAEELGRYEDLAELVQNWQAVEGDPARAMTLSIRRADALLRGGQRDQARSLIASLEAMAPGFIVLTSAAERDGFARKDAGALAATYLTAAHAAMLGTWLGPGQPPKPDLQAAATLYVQAAELLAYEVGTPEALDEARAALGKALESFPEHPAARAALIELDDLTGNITDALARLRAAVEVSEDDAKRAMLDRAIRLARSHGDLDALLDLERQVVAHAPADMAARWRLEATLAQLARDEERADLLVTIAADETDATGRGTALLAAARLRERAGAVEAATELYRQVLALWPDDTFARESLLDLLRAQERWQELVAERRGEARSLPDGAAARRALREAAWVLEVRLGDAAQAAQVYEDWTTRLPTDSAALEGLARCRAAFGDRNGEATVRGTISEAEQSVDAAWLHARALERAGQFDAAAELYRSMLASEEPSIAATNAALALGDIAAARADTVMRVEATAALAGRTGDPRLGAALAEDSGWMYALVLEDTDRAAQSFEAAIALDPTRRGAHLGAALVAGRRANAVQLARAYEGLAGAVDMPEAAAALLLRGAAMAAAAGDLELANQRIMAARNAAPDDTSALLVTAETATAPQVDGADAFAAVDPLLARVEVLEMRSALADDASARASWELDRAEALELAGRMREAGAVVAAVLKTRPDDLRALTALRRMATRAGDKATAAAAAYSMARTLGDPQAKLELLREAAAVFDGPGMSHNSDYAIAAYRRILSLEPGAPEFERVLELLRERADTRLLITTLSDRLGFHDSEGHAADSTVPILLERATVLHGLGDTEMAIADLESLLARAPNHVEALRFRADIAFHAGDVDVAVTNWRRYLSAETRPNRRNEIELQLAQVLAENTNDIGGAIEQLQNVVDANPEDVPLRERLLGLCLRANDWERAVRELRALARMRPTPQDKAREELRLGLMLRDRLDDRAGARLALDRARTLDPLNLEVVRELADLLDPAPRGQVLAVTAQNVRETIAQTPGKSTLYEKLAQVNAWQGDVDGRWLSLVALEALGTPTADQKQAIAQGRQSLSAPARVKLDETAHRHLRGSLGGALHELWRAISPAVQVATGVDVGKLGFARGDKLAIKKLVDKYEPVATALACFGIDDVDVYISAGRAGFARALAAETPILCLGGDVAAAATSHNRFLLGRAVATLAEGVATLPELREGELGWTIAAALKAVDLAVPAALQDIVAGDDVGIAERAKVLKKELSRKAKAHVTQLAQARSGELAEVDAFRRNALVVGHRGGLLWASDLAVALAILDVGKGGRALADSPAALDLAGWSVSDAHLRLREQLSLALKGSRGVL
jgi:tetratricopeptide (TPR) repeat protein